MATSSGQGDGTSTTDTNIQGNKEDMSLVEYFGSDCGFCGYCKRGPKDAPGMGKRSHNLNTYRLKAADYQDMIDTNWRRSGNFCYNPINQTSCCPNYPIICKALEFVLSGSQRRCIISLNTYLLEGYRKSSSRLDYAAGEKHLSSREELETTSLVISFEDIKKSRKAKMRRFAKACERRMRLDNIGPDEAVRRVMNRRKRRGSSLVLEDYLFPTVDILKDLERQQFDPKHKLTIEMHHVDCRRSQDLRRDEHLIMIQYQQRVHKETIREWDMSRYCDFLVNTPLVTEPLRNYDYLEQEDENSAHNDKLAVDVNASQVSRYLLVKPPPLPTAYGTYHCCYFIDEKLIGVGVLDVLPKCITTVYFFYDPQYSFLNLGTYSALIEISMVRNMNRHVLDRSLDNPLTDYYLGFYVHECKKMHYKTTFRPSYLLCSRTHKYVPTDSCLKKLKDRKYADFSDAADRMGSDRELDLKTLLQIEIEPPVDLPSQELTVFLALIQRNLGPEYAELLLNGWLVPYAKIIGEKLLPRLRLKLDGIYLHLKKRHERLTNRSSQTRS